MINAIIPPAIMQTKSTINTYFFIDFLLISLASTISFLPATIYLLVSYASSTTRSKSLPCSFIREDISFINPLIFITYLLISSISYYFSYSNKFSNLALSNYYSFYYTSNCCCNLLSCSSSFYYYLF